MDQERRKFLQQLAGTAAAGIAQTFKVSASVALGGAAVTSTASAVEAANRAAAVTGGAAVSARVGISPYGSGVRAQVTEVIVRRALAGAPWKEICAGPMQVNGITEAEIEQRILARSLELHSGKENCRCTDCLLKREKYLKEQCRLYNEALASIVHSKEAPCACNDCYQKIWRMRLEVKH